MFKIDNEDYRNLFIISAYIVAAAAAVLHRL